MQSMNMLQKREQGIRWQSFPADSYKQGTPPDMSRRLICGQTRSAKVSGARSMGEYRASGGDCWFMVCQGACRNQDGRECRMKTEGKMLDVTSCLKHLIIELSCHYAIKCLYIWFWALHITLTFLHEEPEELWQQYTNLCTRRSLQGQVKYKKLGSLWLK